MDYNLKERELWCPYCKEITLSKEPAGKCIKCHHELITVIRKDGLDTRYNQPT
jgi:Zn finger protein HypA/HybF involved in hydrogenase expression